MKHTTTLSCSPSLIVAQLRYSKINLNGILGDLETHSFVTFGNFWELLPDFMGQFPTITLSHSKRKLFYFYLS